MTKNFIADDFWLISENLILINETVKSLNLTLNYQPKSFWYFQLMTQFDQSFKVQSELMGTDTRDIDEMKRMFSETNPFLLAVTMFVSILHSVFDFLAFKNGIIV